MLILNGEGCHIVCDMIFKSFKIKRKNSFEKLYGRLDKSRAYILSQFGQLKQVVLTIHISQLFTTKICN